MEAATPNLLEILDSYPIFLDMAPQDRFNLCGYFIGQAWSQGSVLFVEGERSDVLIFLCSGDVSVQKKDKTGSFKELANVSGHVSLGESAFIGDDLRSATAIAKTDVVGMVLTRERYELLCKQDPFLANQFLRKINRLLALKLRRVSKDYAELKLD